MKRLLLPLLASLALPTAANAESYWLIVRRGDALEKIEMINMEECEKQGRRWQEAITYSQYFCIIGK